MSLPTRRTTPATLRGDRGGVSDVLGNILMVGITVMMAIGFGAILFAFKGPTDSPQSAIAISVDPGNAAWGNGDEKIVVRHNGGEPLKDSETSIVYTVNGSAPVTVTRSALNFAGGQLKVGQSWSRTLTLGALDVVRVSVISGRGATSLIGQAVVVPAQFASGSSCPFDGNVPTGSWVQSADASTALGSTGIDVTVTLQDDCAGVDASATPHLFSAITPGSPSDQGAMTKVGAVSWRATIAAPAGGWALQGFQTLNYYASPVKDLRGNSGSTATRSDVVDLTGSQKYVTSNTDVAGTLTGFGNLGADDGSVATVQEGLVGGCTPGTVNLGANAVVTSGSGWSNGVNALSSSADNSYATNNNNGPGALRLGFPNPTAGCSITAVKVKVEQSIQSFSNDQWQTNACFAGTGCATTPPANQPGTSSASADTILTFDVTNFRPGGGSWTWTDINNFEASVLPVIVSGRDGTWRADLVTLEVTSAQTYTLTEQLDWTAVPVGSQTSPGVHYLDLKVAGASDEGFNINVFNWATSTYTTRLSVSGTTMQQLSPYLLGANEYQVGTGNVRLQIVDTTPSDLTQSSLTIDYARVDTV